jgi:exodeoxyribonuclease VII small subunit
MANSAKEPTLTYEAAYTELQLIVRELQEETIGVDELTTRIERANALIRFCRERLRKTEEELGRLTDSSEP